MRRSANCSSKINSSRLWSIKSSKILKKKKIFPDVSAQIRSPAFTCKKTASHLPNPLHATLNSVDETPLHAISMLKKFDFAPFRPPLPPLPAKKKKKKKKKIKRKQ